MLQAATTTSPADCSQSMRARVLAVVEAAEGTLSARQIARSSGLTYKQTVDALNALHNHGLVHRTGRKFTARWGKLPAAQPHPALVLDAAFRGFFSCQP